MMDTLAHHLLSILIFLPAAGALALVFITRISAARWTALGVSTAAFGLCLSLLLAFDWRTPGPYAYRSADVPGVVQLAERSPKIPGIHCGYLVGIDGISMPLLLTATFIFPVALLCCWRNFGRIRAQLCLVLLLESASLGTFLSLDLVLFFLFPVASATLVCLLLGAYGGLNSSRAALQTAAFSVITLIALLIAIVGIYLKAGSFDAIALAGILHEVPAGRVFLVLLLASLAIRLPLAPLHGWVSDAISEASTPVAMLIGPVMLNAAGYGIIRIALPLFPAGIRELRTALGIWSVASFVFLSLSAIRQTDFRRMLIQAWLAQTGLVLLGITTLSAAGANGAILLMSAHSLCGALLWFLVNALQDRVGGSDTTKVPMPTGGMPILAASFTFGVLALLGMPGLCMFPGMFLIITSVFQSARQVVPLSHAAPMYLLAGAVCLGSSILAGGLLWRFSQQFCVRDDEHGPAPSDLAQQDFAPLAILATVMVLLGLLPGVLVSSLSHSAADAVLGTKSGSSSLTNGAEAQ